MSDTDLDVAGRLNDGFQYRLVFVDGTVEYLRDHDAIGAVKARLLGARTASAKAAADGNFALSVEASHVDFSGAREVEGLDDKGAPQIGPVRQKGYVDAVRVQSVSYSDVDGTQPSNAAFEAAAALLDVQRAAQMQLMETLSKQQVPAGGESADEGDEGLLG